MERQPRAAPVDLFADGDHVDRAAWRSHGRNAERIKTIRAARPDVPIVVLTSHHEIAHWLRGPLAIALANGDNQGKHPRNTLRRRSDVAVMNRVDLDRS